MKIRIQGNVIRFRLNRREVGEFSDSGRVSAFVHFPGRSLGYALVKGPETGALFDGDEIRVVVAEAAAAEWVNTEQVGITARTATAAGELEIIVEKDFQCMHKGEEGKDPEAYPNPMAAQSS
jgi:hypothetical protein